MSTTKNLTVRKGLPYQVKARADGKWDLTSNQMFTAADESVSLSMTAYNGLDMSYSASYESADTLNFSNTVLPWKWQYSASLTTDKFCLMPIGQTYENITETSGATPISLQGCTYNFTDDGSATTLNCFSVNGDESVVLTPDNSYEEEGTTIDYSDIFSGSVNILECYAFIFAEGSFDTEWQWNNQYELVGHPTDNYSVISNFSAGNYARSLVSFTPNNKMWELAVGGNIGSVGTKQVIFESEGLQIGITPEGHPYATFTGENGVIGTSTVSSFTVSPDDGYFFVCSYAKFNWESDFHYDITAYDPDSGYPNEGNQVISTIPIKSSIFKFGLSMREAPSQARLLGTVSIPAHTVYEYDNGTWTEAK